MCGNMIEAVSKVINNHPDKPRIIDESVKVPWIKILSMNFIVDIKQHI